MAIHDGAIMLNTSIDDLRERINIVYYETTRNNRGDVIRGEQKERATCWARVYVYGAKSDDNGITRINDINYRVTIRYRADVLPDDEIMWRGKRLLMTAPAYDVESRHVWTVMECREAVADGSANTGQVEEQP